jgi:hypothetical protein
MENLSTKIRRDFMNETNSRFARTGFRLTAVALLGLSPFCAQKTPAPVAPTPVAAAPVADTEWIRRATATCTNLARDQGLHVIEYRSWAKSASGTWDAAVQVRSESGGLAYNMACRYDPARDKGSLTRP